MYTSMAYILVGSKTHVYEDSMNGNDLATRRRALGLSQARMAQALGLKVDTLQNWEIGRRNLPFPTMLDLALQQLELRQQLLEKTLKEN